MPAPSRFGRNVNKCRRHHHHSRQVGHNRPQPRDKYDQQWTDRFLGAWSDIWTQWAFLGRLTIFRQRGVATNTH